MSPLVRNTVQDPNRKYCESCGASSPWKTRRSHCCRGLHPRRHRPDRCVQRGVLRGVPDGPGTEGSVGPTPLPTGDCQRHLGAGQRARRPLIRGTGGGRWRPPRRPAEQQEQINDRCPTVRSLEPRPPRRPSASPFPYFRHRANPSPRIIHRKSQQVQRRRTRPAELARYSGAKVPRRKNEPGRGGYSIVVGTAITTSSPSAPAAPAPRRRTSGRTRPPPGSTPPPPSPLRSSPSTPAARPSAITGRRPSCPRR